MNTKQKAKEFKDKYPNIEICLKVIEDIISECESITKRLKLTRKDQDDVSGDINWWLDVKKEIKRKL